jgi:diguanylate cyclase (GGDEF)-like protein
MELGLVGRSLGRGRWLISNHPALDRDLADLHATLAASDSVVHILLLRAHQATHGIVAVHWLSAPRPGYERRSGVYQYWDSAGLARHAGTHPLGVLVLDFDGMRAANAAFENDHARGGDVLIVAVARALQRFAGDADLPARMHTRGDEFCLIMPGCDEAGTAHRCDELQGLLDGLAVPESHRHVYHGASVGGAARVAGEGAAETLARASRAMHERKRATRSR